MRIPVSLLKKNENQFPITEKELSTRKSKIKKESGPELDGNELAKKRKDMITAVAPENPVDAYERYVGKNDLLSINYLQIGTLKSKAVGRLRFTDLTINRQVMATGFLISPDLLLTNHHVFPAVDSFENAQIDFDYAYDIKGNELPKIVFEVDGKKFFFSDKDLDFSIVGISDTDLTGKHKITERGFLVLNPATGKAGIGDAATIIQYPDGNYQQIGLRQNEILDVSNPNSMIYQTDTSHGTSGSPVFNDQWQVIALHSAGVARKNTRGRYIDKNGNAIPVVDGQVDTALIDWISNTGTRISALLKKVFSESSIQSTKYIQFLKSSAYTDVKGAILNSAPSESLKIDNKSRNVVTSANSNSSDNPSNNDINENEMNPSISFPNNAGSINIYLGSSGARFTADQNLIPGSDLGIESKVLEKTLDYSDCKGFQTKGFMSFETPMPILSRQLARKSVYMRDNPKSNILDYYYYSTIQHAVRKMPVISAINVQGNVSARKDHTKRADKWLRDSRIDESVQLDDAYYSKSGFDKGHMSRREDADYGANASNALQAANLTCMYTNACPQVPKLNRAPGLWGDLEKIVLEEGAKKETGTESKICVYNGPVFVDTDPVYDGIQVPMRFFKIVVWLNGKDQKKTTAFILSQEDLVGGIQFEELDYNKEFVEHQCSVSYIEGLTGLTFTKIRDWDTYVKPAGKQSVKAVSRQDVESLIKRNSR